MDWSLNATSNAKETIKIRFFENIKLTLCTIDINMFIIIVSAIHTPIFTIIP